MSLIAEVVLCLVAIVIYTGLYSIVNELRAIRKLLEVRDARVDQDARLATSLPNEQL